MLDEEAYDWEHLQDRSDAEWFEDDVVEVSGANPAGALNSLVSAGCSRAELLSYLREIREASIHAVDPINRQAAKRLIKCALEIADVLTIGAGSPLTWYVRRDGRTSPDTMRMLAAGVAKALAATRRSQRPDRDDLIKQLLRYVDGRVRERGRLGKRKADIAVAVLLEAATLSKWTADAVRVGRARLKKQLGLPRVHKQKVQGPRRLRGSSARKRQANRVSLDVAAVQLWKESDARRR